MKKVFFQSCSLIALIALFLVYAGCASKQVSTEETPGLMISDEITFSDIPVPEGFKLLRQQSYAFKDGQSRIALLRYKSGEKLNMTSMFYQDMMSQYNWEEVKIIDYEKNIQQYVKGDELCFITIENINEPFFGIIKMLKTQITIQLIPMPENASQTSISTSSTADVAEVTPVRAVEEDVTPRRRTLPMSVLK